MLTKTSQFTPTIPVNRVFLGLAAHMAGQESGIIAAQKRAWLSNKFLDKVTWKTVTANSAYGVIGGSTGRELRNMDLHLTTNLKSGTITMKISPNSLTNTLGWIIILICVVVPYLWPCLLLFGVLLITFGVHSKRFFNNLAAALNDLK
jgi:hypothetical protein